MRNAHRHHSFLANIAQPACHRLWTKGLAFWQQTRAEASALLHAETSAHAAAYAFALGTFVNLLPIPGLDMLLMILLLRLSKQLQRAPFLLSAGVWNGVIITPLYPLYPRIGAELLAHAPLGLPPSPLLALALQTLIGNLTLTLCLTALSYAAVLAILHARRCGHGQGWG